MTNPEEAPKAGEQPLEVAAPPAANDDAADEEGEAPTLVEAKPEDDGAAQKDLDDESPKTFPQVVRCCDEMGCMHGCDASET